MSRCGKYEESKRKIQKKHKITNLPKHEKHHLLRWVPWFTVELGII